MLAACMAGSLLVAADNGGAAEFYIDNSEGGSTSARLRNNLQLYLEQAGCSLQVRVGDSVPEAVPALSFSALAGGSAAAGSAAEPSRALTAVTSGDGYSQAAILVRESTGIDSVDKLGAVHMAFVGERSLTGYRDQRHLLERSGIELDPDKTVFTDNHVGAISLLMHKDVFVAGVDAGLAGKWAAANGLRIIALGPEREPGGISISPSLGAADRAACSEALAALRRDEKPGKSIMKLFPDWVVSFKLSITR